MSCSVSFFEKVNGIQGGSENPIYDHAATCSGTNLRNLSETHPKHPAIAAFCNLQTGVNRSLSKGLSGGRVSHLIWISEERWPPASFGDYGEIRQLMARRQRFTHDMPYGYALRHLGIGNHPSMTTPPDGFRAHDTHTLFVSTLVQFCYPYLKFLCLHVIRVRPKACVLPPRIYRLRPGGPKSA